MRFTTSLLAATSILSFASPALAAPGDPIALGDDIVLDITATARIRYETVDQANQADNADAVTARARIGAAIKGWGFEFLAEGEASGALVDDYNDTLPRNGVEPFPVVADPENIQLNRLQLSFMQNGTGATIGRQRINMGNQRFVGSVGWRQNEQTFDALRLQGKLGPVTLDGVLAVTQHTIFGSESPNADFNGAFQFLNAAIDLGPVDATAFAYVIDYDSRVSFSSQTYGLLASAEVPIGGTALKLSGTYATQSDMGSNPANYSADFISISAGVGLAGLNLAANYEVLGSDGGLAAFQTPMATGHAFQGWADVFLTTPAAGVRDYNASLGRQVAVPGIGNVNAVVAYHEFESDFGGLKYGTEWDASLGFRVGPVALLAKYANYSARGFAVDTEKFWLQAEYTF